MNPRPYQQRAIAAPVDDFAEVASTLIVMATGLGKTVVFSHLAKQFIEHGRVLVLVHREELAFQAADKLEKITGHRPDIEMGDLWADRENLGGWRSPIIISTVQTMNAGMGGKGRMSRFSPHEFSLVIVDEAHHATAISYGRPLAHFRQNPALKVLGVTATPDRADEEALGQVFERVAFVYEISDGIDDGFLAPITQRIVHVGGLDFSECRNTAGDLNGADLAAVLEYESNLHGIAGPTYELADGRKTLLFAASVAQAERLCEILNRHKPECARFICGETDTIVRRQALKDYAAGRFQFLVNCGVFVEGFDEPGIQVVAVARPTKSRALYTQMVGRGTRPLDGLVDGLADADARKNAIAASAKPCVEVLDFVGNCGRHKLMSTADILGGNYSSEVVDLAEKRVRESGKAVDMRAALEAVAGELAERKKRAEEERRREAASRSGLVARAKYSTATINPFDVLDIAPPIERGWDKGKPASQKQVDLLRRFGVEDGARMNFTQAQRLVGQLIQRAQQERCTYKQAKLLQRYGYSTDTSFADARKIIDAIAANGWKRPAEADLVGAREGSL